MTPFNWRVLSPATLRAYTLAARDFEQVTGCRIQDADEASIAAFRSSMEGRKLSVSTIRQRLSAVAVLSGVEVELPKRSDAGKRPSILNAEQVRSVMAKVTDPDDRMLLMKMLMLGRQARTITVPHSTFAAHFAGEQTERTLSAQQASRKIKRYALQAGLDETQVSLRIWCQSGQALVKSMEALEIVRMVGSNLEPGDGANWKPLHGIGRRSRTLDTQRVSN